MTQAPELDISVYPSERTEFWISNNNDDVAVDQHQGEANMEDGMVMKKTP
jgi:hypothetical protein